MNNITEDSVIYASNLKGIYNINKGVKLEIHNYCVDEDIDIIFNLNAEGAELEYYFSDINTTDHTFAIKINHLVKNTSSKVFNHGVNKLNNKLIFDVTAKVDRVASGCVLHQENQIINLNDGNSVIKPNLLIDNYDGTSSHAAFIGNFKDETIFYLMSRGIEKKKAIELLMSSFLINQGQKDEKVVKEFMSKIEGE